MKIIIDQQMFTKYSGITIGVIVVKDLNNQGSSLVVQKQLKLQEKTIRNKFSIESLGLVSEIAIWRKAYQSFGAKPKDHRSSVENLYRLVLEGTTLKHINNLVDIYNFISLKYVLPVGGEDLDKIEGDIELTLAKEKEPPVLLLGDKDPRPPHPGEVIYKDDFSAICRRWNWREADRTKLTEQTKNCILVIEGLSPISEKKVLAALEDLKSLVVKYCGGRINTAILNKDNPELELI